MGFKPVKDPCYATANECSRQQLGAKEDNKGNMSVPGIQTQYHRIV